MKRIPSVNKRRLNLVNGNMQSLSISWIRTLLSNWDKVFALQVLIQVLLLHANLNIINLVLVRSRHRSKLLNDHFCYLRFDVSFAFDINYLLYLLVIVCACQSKKAFILLLHSKFPIDINYFKSKFLHGTLY